jgi:hypothetical protein
MESRPVNTDAALRCGRYASPPAAWRLAAKASALEATLDATSDD